MRAVPARRLIAIVTSLFLFTSSCVVRLPVTVKSVPVAEPVSVKSPVKAHLEDGSTIVYPDGVSVVGGKLVGAGTRYDLTLKETGRVTEVPLSDVVALEAYENNSNPGLTMLASGTATVLTVVGAALLAVAIFGSCPTVYTGDELEAELFSYSIAPLFEMNDLDRLTARADADGVVELKVQNEALETHYLNHLALVEVAHDADERIVPDEKGRPLALKNFAAPARATDGRGRDLLPLLRERDGRVFRTDAAVLERVTKDDYVDAIEVEIPVAAGEKEVAVAMRLRNSLLNTVLFYDTMLASAGPKSLDWLNRDLAEAGPAFELAAWYASRMGMRVEVWRDGAFRPVTRIGDSGPIAWKDVAVVVPVAADGEPLRVRLSFVADNWRIDRIEIARAIRRPDLRTLPVAEVVPSDGSSQASAVESLAAADRRYLQTYPGQAFRARFAAGVSERPRTFLLQSRGYYTEWIRRSWLESSPQPRAFRPGDEALVATIARWREVQHDFERRFEATRLPVR